MLFSLMHVLNACLLKIYKKISLTNCAEKCTAKELTDVQLVRQEKIISLAITQPIHCNCFTQRQLVNGYIHPLLLGAVITDVLAAANLQDVWISCYASGEAGC